MRPLRYCFIAFTLMMAANAQAQITQPRRLSSSLTKTPTLEELLINELRATREDQQEFIRFLVEKVDDDDLERRLVLAVERYSIRRNRFYPFPYFERAMRVEAAKRRVILPSVQAFATTKSRTPK